jgi:NAD(P)-dependent dehydrogenase (short-subunit alcohol dehydrogenase family)
VTPGAGTEAAGRLQGKTAIVTGSGSGIGRGCALMFARQGAQVVACDVDTAAAEATVAFAGEEGLSLESLHPCDLTDPADVDRLMSFTFERYGGVDILLNAAAFAAFAWIEEMDYESQWRRTLTGELDIVFLACKAAWPYLIAGEAVPSSISPR